MFVFNSQLPRKQSYRVGEVASCLGVHVSTVRRWLDEGKLSGVRLGGQRRVPLEGLQRFIVQKKPK